MAETPVYVILVGDGETVSPHLLRMMNSLPFGPIIEHDANEARASAEVPDEVRAFLDEQGLAFTPFRHDFGCGNVEEDVNILFDSLMPPPVDAFDALMREPKHSGMMVIRHRDVDLDHSIGLSSEPKKSRREELCGHPKSVSHRQKGPRGKPMRGRHK